MASLSGNGDWTHVSANGRQTLSHLIYIPSPQSFIISYLYDIRFSFINSSSFKNICPCVYACVCACACECACTCMHCMCHTVPVAVGRQPRVSVLDLHFLWTWKSCLLLCQPCLLAHQTPVVWLYIGPWASNSGPQACVVSASPLSRILIFQQTFRLCPDLNYYKKPCSKHGRTDASSTQHWSPFLWIHPRMDTPGQITVLFFVLQSPSILFSIVAVTIYIPANSMQLLPVLPIFGNIEFFLKL